MTTPIYHTGMTLTHIVYTYIKNGMSASASQVYDLIPKEIRDNHFSNPTRSKRTGSICHAIYALIDQGKITETKGRYYITGGHRK